ncbi:MAG: tyrosine-protein phosphatase [Desulfitobacteriaceae bacterium]
MIDIHNHILPGLDDGAKSMEETLGMVRQLQTAGFHTLIATPHVMEGGAFLSPEEILEVTELVQQQVTEAGISVRILPGAENYIFPDMAKWASEGKLITLGNTGKYLLVELPMLEIPRYTDQVFFDLQVNGITPVLAHPERQKVLVDEPERLLDWARKGILFQLDLRSMSGKYGSEARRLAELMLRSDLVHFIGTDAHRIARSELAYQEAFENVSGIVEEKKFQELTLTNPQNVLEGKTMEMESDKEYFFNEPVLKKRKSGFWGLLINRILIRLNYA